MSRDLVVHYADFPARFAVEQRLKRRRSQRRHQRAQTAEADRSRAHGSKVSAVTRRYAWPRSPWQWRRRWSKATSTYPKRKRRRGGVDTASVGTQSSHEL